MLRWCGAAGGTVAQRGEGGGAGGGVVVNVGLGGAGGASGSRGGDGDPAPFWRARFRASAMRPILVPRYRCQLAVGRRRGGQLVVDHVRPPGHVLEQGPGGEVVDDAPDS